MAQLAMAQEGGQAPAILSRVKTQAAEKNVFIKGGNSGRRLE